LDDFSDKPSVWNSRDRFAGPRANFSSWELEVSGDEAVLVTLELNGVLFRVYI